MEKINSFELTISNCLKNIGQISATQTDSEDFQKFSYGLLHHELYRHGWSQVFSPDYFKNKYNLTFEDTNDEAKANRSLLRMGYYSYLHDVVCFKDHYRYVIQPFGDVRKVSKAEYEEALKQSGELIPWTDRYIYYIYFYFLICLIEAGTNREVSRILSYHEKKFAPNLKPIFKEQLRLILRDDPFREILDKDKKITVTEWLDLNVNLTKKGINKGASFEIAAKTLWEVQGKHRMKISDHPDGTDAFFEEIALIHKINPERLRKNYGALSEGLTKTKSKEHEQLLKYTARIVDSLTGQAQKLAKDFLS